MQLRVIIVNFNAGEALLSCVEAVLAWPGELVVSVVDNASTDGSLEAVEAGFPGEIRLEIHRNGENLGFARAVNQIAKTTSEPYLLVLNPDCVLAQGALDALVAALEMDRAAALAGPWVTDSSGMVQSGTWRHLPDPTRSFMTVTGLHRLSAAAPVLAGVNHPDNQPPQEVIRAEAVSGACMLLRRSAVEPLGYLDEGYAMHCEDLDLMFRLQAAGFHCLLVPAARAIHAGGVSSASRPWWVHRQKHLGMQRYFRKFLARNYAAPSRWLVYAGIWVHYLCTLPLVLLRRLANTK